MYVTKYRNRDGKVEAAASDQGIKGWRRRVSLYGLLPYKGNTAVAQQISVTWEEPNKIDMITSTREDER